MAISRKTLVTLGIAAAVVSCCGLGALFLVWTAAVQIESAKPPSAEVVASLNEYGRKLATIRDKIAALDRSRLQPIACDAAAIKRAVQKQYPTLSPVYGPHLKRFGGDKSLWKKDDGPWAWLTDPTFRGHFERHPDERGADDLGHTAGVVKDTFLPSLYLIVIWPDDQGSNQLPEFRGKDQPYVGGHFQGWMFVADQNDASIVCQAPLDVRNSQEIRYRTGGRGVVAKLREQDPAKVLRNDFEDNFEAAVEKALGDGIEVSAAWGSLFK